MGEIDDIRVMTTNRYGGRVEAALRTGEGCHVTCYGGRGMLQEFPLDDGTGIIRTCRRGGLVGKMWKEGYLFYNRPRNEWVVHMYLYDSRFPVPEPLGVAWWERGPLFGGAIATRKIEGRDLVEVLTDDRKRAETILVETGRLIRRLHDMGVYHADLQVRNILVAADGPYIIDFDNARRFNSLSDLLRMRNLLRLRRSFQKNKLDPADFGILAGAYGISSFPSWLDTLYRLKGIGSDVMAGRRGGA